MAFISRAGTMKCFVRSLWSQPDNLGCDLGMGCPSEAHVSRGEMMRLGGVFSPVAQSTDMDWLVEAVGRWGWLEEVSH